jgi:hypothetical protein
VSGETFDPFERDVAGSRCPRNVVPDPNGSSYALLWAQVRLLTQRRTVFEPNYP